MFQSSNQLLSFLYQLKPVANCSFARKLSSSLPLLKTPHGINEQRDTESCFLRPLHCAASSDCTAPTHHINICPFMCTQKLTNKLCMQMLGIYKVCFVWASGICSWLQNKSSVTTRNSVSLEIKICES